VMLMLEATIGLNDVTNDSLSLSQPGEAEDGEESDGKPFNSHDVNFLKSLRISVEGEE
jgi:hypothetical protein